MSWDVAVFTCLPRIPAPLHRHGQFGCALPLDSDRARSRPDLVTPWSHIPICANRTTQADVDSDGPLSRLLCVYTNERHGLGGLSVVTTPETAVDVDMQNILTEDAVDSQQQQQLADRSDSDTETSTATAYAIVDTSHGKGVVATRHIRPYQVFMADYAALVVDLELPLEVPRREGYQLLNAAVDQLDDPRRVYHLAQTSSVAQNAVENVLRSNAFHTDLGGRPHMALFPEVSAHGSAFPRFLPGSLAASVVATRDIQPGEEITISYITLGQTYAARQAALQRWGFTCTCALCSKPEDERAISDERRTRIERLRDGAVAAFQAGDAYEALQQTKEVLQNMEAEQLFALYAEQYENVARIHMAAGNRHAAREAAQQSLDILAQQGYIQEQQRRSVDELLATLERDT